MVPPLGFELLHPPEAERHALGPEGPRVHAGARVAVHLGQAAASGALGDLFVLQLGGERLRGPEERARGGPLEILGHELQRRPGHLDPVEDDRRVELVATHSVEGVREKDVSFAQRRVGGVEARPMPVCSGPHLALHDGVRDPSLLGPRSAGSLLRVEA